MQDVSLISTDPKTVLCVYFKAGHCEKGSKCKFSHDRNVERKVEKVNLYEDTRDKEKDKKAGTWWLGLPSAASLGS